MERLANFTMFAKDREAAGALLSMKVEGNAGPEIDRVVRRDLINLRIFHMEYDMCYGRLPSSFARGFGLQVASFVLLRDPNQNEVKNQGTNEYRNSVARYGSNAIFPPTVFYHTIVKELTAADISSGVLKLFGNWLWISVMIKICLVYFLEVNKQKAAIDIKSLSNSPRTHLWGIASLCRFPTTQPVQITGESLSTGNPHIVGIRRMTKVIESAGILTCSVLSIDSLEHGFKKF
ncbi:hypothetical protein MTR_4g082235 [Medicago truncatula]|uniref:Uncharacterized protein n=1 Tax=Medicago truncatula TaxID=3880 RepID=A0A072UM57_MEDTR|nr:hypothetical protein MTR_4g082235 [Medicago truncatula]